MRHVGIVLVAMSLLAIVGCKPKEQAPQTMAEPQPAKPLEAIPPAEETQPAPAPVATPAPTGPTSLEKLAPAATPEPAPATRSYTVQKGDTLWSISVRMLGNGQRWREIVDLNPGLEPTKLRIGQVILIPAK